MRADTPSAPERGTHQRHGATGAFPDLDPWQPTESPRADAEVRWERVDLDRYAVLLGGRTLGFIDVIGTVFVALRGARYARAVEVAQTLAFDDAVARLRD